MQQLADICRKSDDRKRNKRSQETKKRRQTHRQTEMETETHITEAVKCLRHHHRGTSEVSFWYCRERCCSQGRQSVLAVIFPPTTPQILLSIQSFRFFALRYTLHISADSDISSFILHILLLLQLFHVF